MAPIAEATLTDFLRDPNAVVEKVERNDVILHRRNAADLRMSLQSRSEANDEGLRFVASLLGEAFADDIVRAQLVAAAEAVPWVNFLTMGEQQTFIEELITTAEAAGELGSLAPIARLLTTWKATAAINADAAPVIDRERPTRKFGSRRLARPSA